MGFYLLSAELITLAAVKNAALNTTQFPSSAVNPAHPAPTLIIHTLRKKNKMLSTMKITALIRVNPIAAIPVNTFFIFLLYPL